MASSIILFVILFSVSSRAEHILPDNYVKCNLSSNLSEFNKCAKTSLSILTSVIINGSSVLNLKSLDPVFIPYVLFESSPNSPINMKLELKNLTFVGFSSLRVVSIESTDIHKNVIVIEGVIPISKVIANYTLNGGILRIPIKGFGLVTMNLKNLNLKYEGKYRRIKRNGNTYLIVESIQMKSKIQNGHVWYMSASKNGILGWCAFCVKYNKYTYYNNYKYAEDYLAQIRG